MTSLPDWIDEKLLDEAKTNLDAQLKQIPFTNKYLSTLSRALLDKNTENPLFELCTRGLYYISLSDQGEVALSTIEARDVLLSALQKNPLKQHSIILSILVNITQSTKTQVLFSTLATRNIFSELFFELGNAPVNSDLHSSKPLLCKVINNIAVCDAGKILFTSDEKTVRNKFLPVLSAFTTGFPLESVQMLTRLIEPLSSSSISKAQNLFLTPETREAISKAVFVPTTPQVVDEVKTLLALFDEQFIHQKLLLDVSNGKPASSLRAANERIFQLERSLAEKDEENRILKLELLRIKKEISNVVDVMYYGTSSQKSSQK
jgi:hypothetical protein